MAVPVDPAADPAADAAPASLSKMAKDKLKAMEYFLFDDFLSFVTLTTKDYEKEDLKKSKEEHEKSKCSRFEGYQKLCLFGLGSMFWGSVTGVLAEIEGKKGNSMGVLAEGKKSNFGWLEYCFVYSAVALVLMLTGLVASTFPDSSWLAPAMSGLGGLQAYIFVMGAFHIGSLKYHSHMDECLYSMIGCSVIIIFYWGLSVQDPLLLHILAKLVLWIIGMTVYGVGLILCYIFLIIMWFIRELGRLCSNSWKYLWSGDDSLKNGLMAWYNKPRDYEVLPSTNGSRHQLKSIATLTEQGVNQLRDSPDT